MDTDITNEEEYPTMELIDPNDPFQWTKDVTFLTKLPEEDADVILFLNDERFENFAYTRPSMQSISLDPFYVKISSQLFILRMEASIVRRLQVGLLKNVKRHSLDFLHKNEWEYIKELWRPYWSDIVRKPLSKRLSSIDYNGYPQSRMVEKIFFGNQSAMPPLYNKKWYLKKWVNYDNKFAAQLYSLIVWYDELAEECACSFRYHSLRKVGDEDWEFF